MTLEEQNLPINANFGRNIRTGRVKHKGQDDMRGTNQCLPQIELETLKEGKCHP